MMPSKASFKNSLLMLVISPLMWALHMLACYILAAVWCAKAGRESSLREVRIGILIFTVVALIPVVHRMIKSFQQHKMGEAELPHDAATAQDRQRFLGHASFLISGLSALAILFIAFNALIFRSCQ